ncbi:hypothetical protein [Rhodopseudomonas pseudopalustris]|nr:hypothetical protein [Rhodopseudomonas pseudopalustris]MBB1092418.1 hypothetical protein [Rhodopseudomonas palustris]SEO73371.1 hypothetical protein SAMN05444123_104257 [Rhodopseudomonas pseudopalustris]
MTHVIRLSAVLPAALVVLAVSGVGEAFARGGAASIMDSPGYQRRLKESREQLQQPYTTPPAVYPRRKLGPYQRTRPIPRG